VFKLSVETQFLHDMFNLTSTSMPSESIFSTELTETQSSLLPDNVDKEFFH